jgi:hypothetical protein
MPVPTGASSDTVEWHILAVGGAIGSAVAIGIASNPAGWVVGAAMFVGATIAGVSPSALFDYFWPER